MNRFARAAIEKAFFKDWCEITDPLKSNLGELNRDTGAIEQIAPAIRYEGPCSVIDQRQVTSSREGVERPQYDEHILRVRSCTGLRRGQIVNVKSLESGDWQEFEISRIPVRSHTLSTHCIIRRRVTRVTAG